MIYVLPISLTGSRDNRQSQIIAAEPKMDMVLALETLGSPSGYLETCNYDIERFALTGQ